jgi:hypothetical protein
MLIEHIFVACHLITCEQFICKQALIAVHASTHPSSPASSQHMVTQETTAFYTGATADVAALSSLDKNDASMADLAGGVHLALPAAVLPGVPPLP